MTASIFCSASFDLTSLDKAKSTTFSSKQTTTKEYLVSTILENFAPFRKRVMQYALFLMRDAYISYSEPYPFHSHVFIIDPSKLCYSKVIIYKNREKKVNSLIKFSELYFARFIRLNNLINLIYWLYYMIYFMKWFELITYQPYRSLRVLNPVWSYGKTVTHVHGMASTITCSLHRSAWLLPGPPITQQTRFEIEVMQPEGACPSTGLRTKK